MKRTLIALLLIAGCNKTAPEAPAAPAAPTAPAAPAPAVAAPAAPAVAVPAVPAVAIPAAPAVPNADQIAQMQKQAGLGQQKTAVNWRELMPLLGDNLAGWAADGEAKGQTTAAMGITISQVDRSYNKDGKHANLQIFDTAVMPQLASAFQMARTMSQDGSDNYARGVDIGGSPAWEQWHKGGSSEVTVLAGGRFLVKASSSGLPDTKTLVEALGKIDFVKLAALNK